MRVLFTLTMFVRATVVAFSQVSEYRSHFSQVGHVEWSAVELSNGSSLICANRGQAIDYLVTDTLGSITHSVRLNVPLFIREVHDVGEYVNGDVFILASGGPQDNDSGFLVMRCDASGTPLWANRLIVPGIQTSQNPRHTNGFIAEDDHLRITLGGTSMIIAEFDQSGSLVALDKYVPTEDTSSYSLVCIQPDGSDGTMLLAQRIPGDVLILHCDQNGSVVQTNLIDCDLFLRPEVLFQRGNGNYLLGGRDTWDPFLLELGPTGAVNWSHLYQDVQSTPLYDPISAIQELANGEFAFSTTTVPDAEPFSSLLVQADAQGFPIAAYTSPEQWISLSMAIIDYDGTHVSIAGVSLSGFWLTRLVEGFIDLDAGNDCIFHETGITSTDIAFVETDTIQFQRTTPSSSTEFIQVTSTPLPDDPGDACPLFVGLPENIVASSPTLLASVITQGASVCVSGAQIAGSNYVVQDDGGRQVAAGRIGTDGALSTAALSCGVYAVHLSSLGQSTGALRFIVQ